jgi:molybdopterin synthase catalytic subunit
MHAYVSVQTQAFDVNAEMDALRATGAQVGAICTFVGLVRDLSWPQTPASAGLDEAHAPVRALELEHYPAMTEQILQQWVHQAIDRFQVLGIRLVHRVGILQATEPIVLVAVSSAHRAQAFDACQYVMDALKTQAPFWKKEHTSQGAFWVESAKSDEMALARWALSDKPLSTSKSNP